MAEKKKKLELTPIQKKALAIAGLILVVFIALNIFGANNDMSSRSKPIENVLTDRSPKELGMESLIAQIKIANDKLTSTAAENHRLQRDFERLKNEVSANRQLKQDTASLQKTLTEIQKQVVISQEHTNDQISKLTAENDRLTKLVNSAPKIERSGSKKLDAMTGQDSEEESSGKMNKRTNQSFNESSYAGKFNKRDNRPFLERPVDVSNPDALYAQQYKPQDNPADVLDVDGNMMPETPNKINVIGSYDNPATSVKERLAKLAKKPDVYLPTGSFIKGVLLSGLYAPTGVNARKDPFPVVLRIQDDAILPNMKRADLRECFLTLSGYGDLSSERALLRGETLSCVANDNSIIETKFPSYAVGEDGKAGISGKLITRNGKALRNAMLSGFASGMSDSLKTERVQKLDITGSSSDTYSNAFSGETLNNGIFNGASEALNKLADYYMSMAEQTFPVIEIDAGREVTVTLTAGATLTTVRESPEKLAADLAAGIEESEVEYPSLKDNPDSIPNMRDK